MHDVLPFAFEGGVTFFEKASAPEGQRRRIAGVISTESIDRQGEVILQRGLDFAPFMKGGYFNDNHSKKTEDVLGYPTAVVQFQKGDKLPDGTTAAANGTWSEGYLLDTKKATDIWDLGRALNKSGRRLGYSVEGTIQKRTGPGGKVVAKAVVRNVAITNCPVNEDTRLEVLAKSLQHAEEQPEEFWKALSASPTTAPGVAPTTTTPGSGFALMPESLEQAGQKRFQKKTDDEEDADKPLTKSEVVERIRARFPSASAFDVERMFDVFATMKQSGKL